MYAIRFRVTADLNDEATQEKWALLISGTILGGEPRIMRMQRPARTWVLDRGVNNWKFKVIDGSTFELSHENHYRSVLALASWLHVAWYAVVIEDSVTGIFHSGLETKCRMKHGDTYLLRITDGPDGKAQPAWVRSE